MSTIFSKIVRKQCLHACNLFHVWERLSRILPNTSSLCKFCPDVQVAANLEHCLFNCIKTKEVGSWLLSLIKQYDPTTSTASLIKLEFKTSGATEIPLVWLTAHTLLYIWGMRLNGKTANLIMTRANLESKVSLWRETRYSNEHLMLEEILARNYIVLNEIQIRNKNIHT